MAGIERVCEPTKEVDVFVTSDEYGADNGSDLALPLRTGISSHSMPLREIHRVWLLEYTLAGIQTGTNANTAGAPVADDTSLSNFEALDFVVMKIDGLQGMVTSNNGTCHGALAVLSTTPHGSFANQSVGATRSSHIASRVYCKPKLIAEYTGGQMPSLRDIVVRLQTRTGADAPLQRAHFWLRVECKC